MKKTIRQSKPRVLAAMSGGVDSSVSAAILQDRGMEVIGLTMHVWDHSRPESSITEGYGTCCSGLDVEDARAVCAHLNIPYYVLNTEALFKTRVIDKFVNSYLNGKTPIPCVDCNTFLKFDLLIQKMRELECQYLATGHYARICKHPVTGKYQIQKSHDDWKDQTYFLFTLSPKVFPHILFPVGNMQKAQVRDIAKKKGLDNVFKKKDSSGLCFVGKEGYSHFIKSYLDQESMSGEKQTFKKSLEAGPIRLHPSGATIGTHSGLYQFTYGQRKGLGVEVSSQPLYVIKIDTAANTLWLGEEQHLYSKQARVGELNWLEPVEDGETVYAKIRFHHKGCNAKVYKKQNTLVLEFEEKQKSVTPGQSAVFLPWFPAFRWRHHFLV